MIDVVIVNWNSGYLLASALESLTGCSTNISKIIVVDNASTDASLQYAVGDFKGDGRDILVIGNSVNVGFGAACNLGCQQGSAPFVLFMNPDAEANNIALEDALAFLLSEQGGNVGIVGVPLLDSNGRVSPTCYRFPTPALFFFESIGLHRIPRFKRYSRLMREWGHDENKVVDQVIGAFFLVRRELFDFLGGFDERFFVYFEEVDFSLRAKQSGWKTFFLSTVAAKHTAGGSTQKVKATRLAYSLHSRFRYARKHFSTFDVCVVVITALFIEPFTRTFYSAVRGGGIREVWAGYFRLLTILLSNLALRR